MIVAKYLEGKFGQFHDAILKSYPGGEAAAQAHATAGATLFSVCKTHKHNPIPATCVDCSQRLLADEFINLHRKKNPTWINSNARLWGTLGCHVQMAKLFCPKLGTHTHAIGKTDFHRLDGTALFNMIHWCSPPPPMIGLLPAGHDGAGGNATEARNRWGHEGAAVMSLDHADFTFVIDRLKALLHALEAQGGPQPGNPFTTALAEIDGTILRTPYVIAGSNYLQDTINHLARAARELQLAHQIHIDELKRLDDERIRTLDQICQAADATEKERDEWRQERDALNDAIEERKREKDRIQTLSEQFKRERNEARDIQTWCERQHVETQQVVERQHANTQQVVANTGEVVLNAIAQESSTLLSRFDVFAVIENIKADGVAKKAAVDLDTAVRVKALTAAAPSVAAADAAMAAEASASSELSCASPRSPDSGCSSLTPVGSPVEISSGYDSEDSGADTGGDKNLYVNTAESDAMCSSDDWNAFVIAHRLRIDELIKFLWKHSVESTEPRPQVEIDGNRAVLVFDLAWRSDLPTTQWERVDRCVTKLVQLLKAKGAIAAHEVNACVEASWHGSIVVLLRASPAVFAAIHRMVDGRREPLELGDGVSLQSIRPVLAVQFAQETQQQQRQHAAFFELVVSALRDADGDVLKLVTDSVDRKIPAVQRFTMALADSDDMAALEKTSIQFLVSCEAIERHRHRAEAWRRAAGIHILFPCKIRAN